MQNRSINFLILFTFLFSISINGNNATEANIVIKNKYKEKKYPTPNIDKKRTNTVEGVILHHTAEPTIER